MVLLGLTSLVTDVSADMFAAVLPISFMRKLKMAPLQMRLIDGLRSAGREAQP